MSQAQKPVTIKSIAAQLGISFSTVSKALNGDPAISQVTRELVQKTAREMNYTPNYFAASLRQRGSKNVAIMVNDIDIPAYGEMIAMISGQLAAHGYTTLVSDARYSPEYERNSIRNMLSRLPEAVIIAPADPTGENMQLLESMYDTTLVLGDPKELPTNALFVDHVHAGQISARRMLKGGVTRNLILAGPEGYQSSNLFLEGIRQVYEEKGLTLDQKLVFRFAPDQQTAYRRFMEVWQTAPGSIDGVICFCDSMAYGIYRACRELGLSIPEDISVIGYDDGPANEFTAPPLTTVHMPKDLVAAQCARFVIDRLVGGDTQQHRYTIAPYLADRGSVK